MSRSDFHRVADMLMAADEIASIVSPGRAAFDDDIVLRRAVERCLEIIGEAAKSVSPEVRGAHRDVPWSDVAFSPQALARTNKSVSVSFLTSLSASASPY